MITAKEAREITNQVRVVEKAQSVRETLEWCMGCDVKIAQNAARGHESVTVSCPRSPINRSFSEEEYYSTIKEFFNGLGYNVWFYHDTIRLAW